MRLVPILKNYNSIFAADFDGEDELTKAFDLWSDVEYLTAFFEENQHDLLLTSTEINETDKAVRITIHEANKLENQLVNIAENHQSSLDEIFRPLVNTEQHRTHQKSKAYGSMRKSWLRLYAVRIEPELYVISGSAIKLTKTMQERVHTKEQLNKLNRVRDYLREKGLFTDQDFKNMEI